MKGIPTTSGDESQRTHPPAFTLVEVMVATLIFALCSTGLTSLFIQNLRFSTWQDHNVRMTNTAFGISDQLRNIGANQLFAAYVAADTASPLPLNVVTVDPADPNDGYRTSTLKINQKNANVVDPSWTTINLPLGRLATSGKIPMEIWLTVRRSKSLPGVMPKFDVLECTFLYRWKVNGSASKTLSQIQLTFPAPNYEFSNQFPN